MLIYNTYTISFNNKSDFEIAVFGVIANRLKNNIKCYTTYLLCGTEYIIFTKESKATINNKNKTIIITNCLVKNTYNVDSIKVNENYNSNNKINYMTHNGSLNLGKEIFSMTSNTFLKLEILKIDKALYKGTEYSIGDTVETFEYRWENSIRTEIKQMNLLTGAWRISLSEFKRSKSKKKQTTDVFVKKTSRPVEVCALYNIEKNVCASVDLTNFIGGDKEEDFEKVIEVIEIK